MGSASAACARGERVGDPKQIGTRDASGTRRRPRASRGCRDGSPALADRRPAPAAGSADPHPGEGLNTTRSPADHPGPSRSADATVPDHSWPRMAPGRAYRSSTRWRSDPQMPHSATSDQDLVGHRFGYGDLSHLDPPISDIDGGRHQARWHGGHARGTGRRAEASAGPDGARPGRAVRTAASPPAAPSARRTSCGRRPSSGGDSGSRRRASNAGAGSPVRAALTTRSCSSIWVFMKSASGSMIGGTTEGSTPAASTEAGTSTMAPSGRLGT